MERASETYIKMPEGVFNNLLKRMDKIDSIYDALQELKAIETPSHYTPKEFMKLAKISRGKFEEIKAKLNIVRVSERKQLIPHSDLLRWFNGEIS